MDLENFAQRCRETDQIPDTTGEWELALTGLVGQVGALADCYKKRLRDGDNYEAFVAEATRETGNVLWYLATLSERMGISLNTAAKQVLTTNARRWKPQEQNSLFDRLYDEKCPEAERLPRKFVVQFVAKTDEQTKDPEANRTLLRKVAIFLRTEDGGKKQLGDEINDNAWKDDLYRFHDVLHLAFAAHLGWSPVMRALLGRKRKKSKNVDEIEDGAAARDTEEAISRIVHITAQKNSWFKAATIDTKLLSLISDLVADREVRDRSYYEWQAAIKEAYAVRDKLVENNGGYVLTDLASKKIVFYKTKPKKYYDYKPENYSGKKKRRKAAK